MLEGEEGFFPKGRGGKLEGKEGGGVAALLMARTIQAVTRPLYAAGATEWLGLNGPHRAEFYWHPGLRQHKICLPNPGCGTRKKLFYQGEDLGWLAPNIHPPKIIRVPTSTQQKDAHDTHQTFKQIVFCQI